MVLYNMTELGNIVTVGGLVNYANVSTDNLLMTLAIFALFFIMIFVMKRWEFDKSLLSSSFACFILSLILTFGGFVNFYIPLLFLITMAFTAFFMHVSR